jgi:flagellar protein FlaG
MIVEPVAKSGKSAAPQVQARLPANQGMTDGDKSTKKPVKEANLSNLVDLATDVQKNMNIMHNVDLRFSVHQSSGQIMVTVIDESTGKVVREIPSSEILELAAKMDEMIGILFDEKG